MPIGRERKESRVGWEYLCMYFQFIYGFLIFTDFFFFWVSDLDISFCNLSYKYSPNHQQQLFNPSYTSYFSPLLSKYSQNRNLSLLPPPPPPLINPIQPHPPSIIQLEHRYRIYQKKFSYQALYTRIVLWSLILK